MEATTRERPVRDCQSVVYFQREKGVDLIDQSEESSAQCPDQK
jgi:hypothetical protein